MISPRPRLRSALLLVPCLLTVGLFHSTLACTTAVISGRVTPDGRPLLWKNRDTTARNNEVAYFDDGTFRCTAVVTAGGTSNIWMGVNEAGLCIENSVISDIAGRDGAKGYGNGDFMLRVLKTCATVGDVEAFLKETDETGRSTGANFGVIDAVGGAAIFETGKSSYTKYDANDPAVAPHGYVVRSNFTFTGQGVSANEPVEKILGLYSGDRYVRGCRLMETGLQGDGELDLKYILRNCCRDLADAATAEPHPGSVNLPGELPHTINTTSTISRSKTVSAAVFQGVKAGEDPALTTMWVLLGEPAFSIAIPCWVATGPVAPELDGPKTSELSDLSRQLRNSRYTEDNTPDDNTVLLTDSLPTIWEATFTTENEFLERTEQKLAEWRQTGPSVEAMTAFQAGLTRQAKATLQRLAEVPARSARIPLK